MYLSLCLIAKDEHTYLMEWLDFHILLGVEHFWIYDNDSITPLTESIQPYIDKGWVTINSIHGKAMQLYAYDHCLRTYGRLSQWIGFIDTDEFFVPKNTASLPDFLKSYEKYGGLGVSSLFFGAGGHKNRPKCGQIAGYLLRTPEELARNRLIKSIVQPSKTLFPISPHSFMYKEGEYCVNELGYRVDNQFFPCSITKIQLNHYYTRSAQEWEDKMNRGRGAGGKAYSNDYWVDINGNSFITDLAALALTVKFLDLPSKVCNDLSELKKPKSSKILDLMSQKAFQLQPSNCNVIPSSEIETRKEFEDLLLDIRIGWDLLEKGNFQGARNLYLKLIQKYPFDLSQYLNFTFACVHLHDFSSAWEALSHAWQMSPRNWSVLSGMIDYFHAIGNFEQVEKCSLLLNEFGNLEPIHVAGLAVAQWKQGKVDQAKKTAKLLPGLTAEMIDSHIWYKELDEFMRSTEAKNK
jgi:hypothetical protein